MAETGPAAIVAALTRAIADDGRGGGATLGGGAPLCPRRRWSCRRVMPEEELVGVVSAARYLRFLSALLPASERMLTYVRG